MVFCLRDLRPHQHSIECEFIIVDKLLPTNVISNIPSRLFVADSTAAVYLIVEPHHSIYWSHLNVGDIVRIKRGYTSKKMEHCVDIIHVVTVYNVVYFLIHVIVGCICCAIH